MVFAHARSQSMIALCVIAGVIFVISWACWVVTRVDTKFKQYQRPQRVSVLFVNDVPLQAAHSESEADRHSPHDAHDLSIAVDMTGVEEVKQHAYIPANARLPKSGYELEEPAPVLNTSIATPTHGHGGNKADAVQIRTVDAAPKRSTLRDPITPPAVLPTDQGSTPENDAKPTSLTKPQRVETAPIRLGTPVPPPRHACLSPQLNEQALLLQRLPKFAKLPPALPCPAYFAPHVTDPSTLPTLDVVVARYAERCTWLLQPPFVHLLPNVIVYNKGPEPIEYEVARRVRAVINLPNVGRCDHTFMYHLVNRMLHPTHPSQRKHNKRTAGDEHNVGATTPLPQHSQMPCNGPPPSDNSLADVTVFLTGSTANLPYKLKQAHDIVNALPGIPDLWPHVNVLDSTGDFKLDTWVASDAENRQLNPEQSLLPAPHRPFKRWFRKTFGKHAIPLGPMIFYGVCVGLRSHYSSIPLDVYARMLLQLSTHSNPEAGHYVERVMGTLGLGTVTLRAQPKVGHYFGMSMRKSRQQHATNAVLLSPSVY